MRGSNGRSRRHRRLVSTTFTVTGLVLSIFLMFGQLGLIVASADDRGRDGTFESDTDVITTDDGSESRGGTGSGGTSVGPQIQSRDDSAVGREALPPIDGGDISLDFIAAGPFTYNHTSATPTAGPGNPQYNGRVISKTNGVVESLEGGDFACNDNVVYFVEIDVEDDAAITGSETLNLTFTFENDEGVGFRAFTDAILNSDDTGDTGDGDEVITSETSNETLGNVAGLLEVDVSVSGVEQGEEIILAVIVQLLCSATGSPNGNLQARITDADLGGDTVNVGQQTIPLKSAADILEAKITITKEVPDTNAQQFDYVATGSGTSNFSLWDDGTTDPDATPQSKTFTGLNAGQFSFVETIPSGWGLDSVTCTSSNGQSQFTDITNGQQIQLADGDTVACVFNNSTRQSNLTITKTANVTQVAPNTQFTYTIDVTNTGNAQATGVVITDNLPDSLTSVSATYDVNPTSGQDGTCDVTAGTNVVTCPGTGQTAIALAASNGANTDTVRVTVTATSPSTCQTLNNTASVQWTQNGTNPPVTSSQSTVTVVGCGIAISKTASPTPDVAAGGIVTFTIMAENQEAGSVTGVVIADTLPAGFTILTTPADKPVYDIDPGTAPDPADCGVVGQTVTCNVGTLAGNDGITGDGPDFVVVTIKATAPNVCGPFSNTATVDWDQNPSQNPVSSNTVNGNVTGCAPSLQLSKTGASTVAIGANITWTITVSNTAGNADATNVVVTDTLPAGFTFVSASAGCVNNTPAAGQVQCTIGTIAAGQSASVTITATAPSTCGPFTNTVSGTFGTGQTIPGSPATSTGDVTGCAPGLTISKSGPATVQQGTSITYTVTVTNNGNASAFNVNISDAVPSPLTNPVGTPSQGSCQTTTNTVNCNLGTIAGGGGSATISITAGVPAGQCVQIQNQATGTHEVDEQNVAIQSSNTVTTQITGCGSPGSPALTVIKTADAAVVTPPSPIGFTITVSNSGSADANNVTLSDTIPAVPGVTWSINGGTGAAQCSLTGNSLSCSFGTLSAGASRSVHIISTATSTASCGTFTNVAVASSSNAGTATGQATVEVECPPGTPSIRIVKEAHPDSGSPGEVITYVYRITNTGDVTLFDISVDDDIVGHICDIPELDPGESVKCTADYTIPEDANIEITNVVIAVGEDENGTEVSDEDEETILVILGTTVTPTPTVTPPGGVAFTGTGVFLPLAGLALLMLTLGTGLLWWGRRRGSHERDMFHA